MNKWIQTERRLEGLADQAAERRAEIEVQCLDQFIEDHGDECHNCGEKELECNFTSNKNWRGFEIICKKCGGWNGDYDIE